MSIGFFFSFLLVDGREECRRAGGPRYAGEPYGSLSLVRSPRQMKTSVLSFESKVDLWKSTRLVQIISKFFFKTKLI